MERVKSHALDKAESLKGRSKSINLTYRNIFCKRLTAGLIFQLSLRILPSVLRFLSSMSSFGELVCYFTCIYHPHAGDPQLHPTQTPTSNNRYIPPYDRYVHLNIPK